MTPSDQLLMKLAREALRASLGLHRRNDEEIAPVIARIEHELAKERPVAWLNHDGTLTITGNIPRSSAPIPLYIKAQP